MKGTSAFIELFPGHCGGSSMALSPSESELELLSESLELVDSSPLECGALTELQKSPKIRIKDKLFLLIRRFGLQAFAYHEELCCVGIRRCWDESAGDVSHFSGMTAKWNKRHINTRDTFQPHSSLSGSVQG